MGISRQPELPGVTPSALNSAEIRAELERILDSPPFRSSRRCSLFLRYIVEAACDGQVDGLKERNLGAQVFDRAPDYDTNQDPVVRTTAGEVRKRLAQYYCEPGREQELRIQLPVGSYVPEVSLPATPVAPEDLETARLPRSRNHLFITGGLGATAAVVTLLWLVPHWRQTELDAFWAPALAQSRPVVLCMGQPRVYRFVYRRKNQMDRLFASGPLRHAPADPDLATVPITDIVPAWNRYISVGDAQTMTRLTELFARKGKRVELRGGRETALSDLRGHPTVLIGAFNNDWTLNLTGQLRFSFQEDPSNSTEFVRDSLHPEKRDWMVRYSTDGSASIDVDYAIVSRVLDPITEQPVIVAAGIAGPATQSAGEFLTNPAYFAAGLVNAPADWHRKNVQFVLSTKVISGNEGPPRVVAAHFW